MRTWIDRLQRLPVILRVFFFVGLILTGWFVYRSITSSTDGAVQYQTAQVTRGTLVVSVSGSGQVTTANTASITTQTSGVVSAVYVKDGDTVQAGDVIATIDPDLIGKQNEAQAYASYQSAHNNLENAKASLYSTQSTMFSQWQSFYGLATNSTYQNVDGSPNADNRALADFHIAQNDWLAAEARYKTQQSIVAQAQTARNSAWLSYQQSSPTIYAPISGTVAGLSLQVGSVISSSTANTSTGSTVSSTKIATIKTSAPPTVTINLTEVDVPRIHVADKATVSFDAITDKTYTGAVISIDTSGTVSSGVTTYPTVVRLDTNPSIVLGNMSATANIIVATKNEVLMVPKAAVQTEEGESYVRVKKNGNIVNVPVVLGLESDTYSEIVSGLTEADVVVTSVIQPSSSASQTQSVFSSFGGRGGNFTRINR